MIPLWSSDTPAMAIYQAVVTEGGGYEVTIAVIIGGGDNLRLLDARLAHVRSYSGTT